MMDVEDLEDRYAAEVRALQCDLARVTAVLSRMRSVVQGLHDSVCSLRNLLSAANERIELLHQAMDTTRAEVERLKSSELVYADQLAATQRLATELRTTNAELGAKLDEQCLISATVVDKCCATVTRAERAEAERDALAKRWETLKQRVSDIESERNGAYVWVLRQMRELEGLR